MEEISYVFVTAVLATVVLLCLHFLKDSFSGTRSVKNIPPGSMGFPFIGETLEFVAPCKSLEIPSFIQRRMLRYGHVFKTNLLGTPMVVGADAEFCQFVFHNDGRLFKPWFPRSFQRLFGDYMLEDENIGKLNRKILMSHVGVPNLKETILSQLQDHIILSLHDWEGQDINILEKIGNVIFEFIVTKLIGHNIEKQIISTLRENFAAMEQGIISVPLAIPGSAFHKSLKAHAKLIEIIENLIDERLLNYDEKKNKEGGDDLVDYVITGIKSEDSSVTKEIACQINLGLLFGSFGSITQTTTLCVKLLTENPETLRRLEKEHETIRGKCAGTKIEWDDYKSMTFTSKAVKETSRMASAVPIFRKATEDITFREMLIPKGWAVMLSTVAVQMDAAAFDDPMSFNPWRWEKNDEAASKHFVVFGGGSHFCPGSELAKMTMSVFLYHFISRFTWEALESGEVQRTPGFTFTKRGYRLRLLRRKQE